MDDRTFWDDVADGMALTIEGERLIVGEIFACIGDQVRGLMRWFAEAAHDLSRAPH